MTDEPETSSIPCRAASSPRASSGAATTMTAVRPEDRRPDDEDFQYLEDDLVLFQGRVCLHSGTSSVFGRTVHHIIDPIDPSGATVGPKRISYVGRWDGITPLARLQHLAPGPGRV